MARRGIRGRCRADQEKRKAVDTGPQKQCTGQIKKEVHLVQLPLGNLLSNFVYTCSRATSVGSLSMADLVTHKTGVETTHRTKHKT